MKNDCCIENWIMKNKTWLWFLFSIIAAWVISAIGLMTFKCWYFDLSWHDSRISLSNIIGLGGTIGAIAVAVFAWMTYKYAIVQYVEQQNARALWEKKYQLLTQMINGVTVFSVNAKNTFFELDNYILKRFENSCKDLSKFKMLQEQLKSWKGLEIVNTEIDKLRNLSISSTHLFSELNLLGVSFEDLSKISECIQETIKGVNEYKNIRPEVSKLINEIISAQHSNCSKKIEELINLNGKDPFTIKDIDSAYSNIMKIGRRLLNIK